MQTMVNEGSDCWLKRVTNIKTLFGINTFWQYRSSFTVGAKLKSHVKGLFQRFWIDEINKIKVSLEDGHDKNKLRVYCI